MENINIVELLNGYNEKIKRKMKIILMRILKMEKRLLLNKMFLNLKFIKMGKIQSKLLITIKNL
jgi:hypothetical protein